MKELNSVEICQRLRDLLFMKEINLKVHSVFSRAVNVIGEDNFFSIISDRYCLYPMSCRVSNEIPFTEYGIKADDKVTVSGNKIYIPEVSLSINLNNSKERDLSLANKEALFLPKDLSFKVETLKNLIREKGCEDDLSTLVTGKFNNPYADYISKRLPSLNEAFIEGSARAVEQAGNLAGCGIGLTPSSDDLLIGSMSAYLADSKAKGYRYEEAYSITNAMGKNASVHTNIVSGAFLKQCGMGLLSDDMTKLMYAIYSDAEAETVRVCGQRIQNLGSTSGTDMLTGVVLAIENLNLR